MTMKIAKYACQVCDAECHIVCGQNFKPPIRCIVCGKYAMKYLVSEEVAK